LLDPYINCECESRTAAAERSLRKNIQAQFLIEALILSSLSGTLGAIVGVVASSIFSRALSWPTIIPPQWIVITVVFSAFIGVFFGFYPASKAALLDPIEALRYE
jgi:putative ABC transport system permease protein